MKKYVGMAKARPDSFTPLRFPPAMMAMKPTAMKILYGVSAGTAETSAAVPAAARHGRGEHVVAEQGHARHLGPEQPEVVLGDDVGAAGARVLADGLAVRQDQEPEDDQHADGKGHHGHERRQTDVRDEGAQDLLGGVRRRRQVVRGEHGEGRGLAQPLVAQLVRGQRRAQDPLLDAVAQRLGQLDQVLAGAGLELRGGLGHGGGILGERHPASEAPAPPDGTLRTPHRALKVR